ncbi:acyl-CoA thioesterase [Limimaricola pyoseonensis]|uniref:4-hydroxybenzoyl-CoA thioesterase n=1 Tax=Limimaricola pyoseonensis TaxID=521013 RepID=A0A1G7JEM4_9RHOB|nr:thioesterase family protein [Limimaricola pyoseonensis]SDF23368.1 4-hydroxybenzoyl-CoA thioesterase [Limimaricola pyoseonensis]
MAFTVRRRVRFEHCDFAGIVFYPRYFEMLNACIEDWFAERLGRSFGQIHGPDGHAVPTARIEVRFTAPSRIDDPLELTLVPLRLGRSSLDLEITVTSGGETRLVAASTLVHVNKDTGRPVAWPEGLRAAIARELEGEPGHGT